MAGKEWQYSDRGKWGPSQRLDPYAVFGGHALDDDSPFQGGRRWIEAGAGAGMAAGSSRVAEVISPGKVAVLGGLTLHRGALLPTDLKQEDLRRGPQRYVGEVPTSQTSSYCGKSGLPAMIKEEHTPQLSCQNHA